MKLIVVENYRLLSRLAADLIAETIAAKPSASIVLPTGNTPAGTYEELARRYRAGQLNTHQLQIFQMDEYCGLPDGHPRTMYQWLKRSALEPLNIDDHRVVRLRGDIANKQQVCLQYDQSIVQAGGLDLVVAGLGMNGHLAFNEPPCHPDSLTRCVNLTAATIESNGAYWGGKDKVPAQALTIGLKHLLAARQLLLLVSGAGKREILHQVLAKPVSPDVPASFLQLMEQAVVLADWDAFDFSGNFSCSRKWQAMVLANWDVSDSSDLP